MSDRSLKDFRKQLRNIVKEVLPEIIKQEFMAHMVTELRAMISTKLNEIDARQKEIQGYMIRQSAKNITVGAPASKKD